MQTKQFVAIFLLVIVSSMGSLTSKDQSNHEQQNNKVVSAVSLLFEETLNNINKTLVDVPKEESGLIFSTEGKEEEDLVGGGPLTAEEKELAEDEGYFEGYEEWNEWIDREDAKKNEEYFERLQKEETTKFI